MPLSFTRVAPLATALMAAAGWACTEATAPSFSTWVVLTSTSGVSPDPDGYVLTLARSSGLATFPLTAGGSLAINRSPGTDGVSLGGVAPNCRAGAYPRTIIDGGDERTDTLRIAVVCGPASGSITFHATIADSSATGPFTVVADGADERQLALGDSTTFSGLADGTHTLVVSNRGTLKTRPPKFCVPVIADSIPVPVSGGGAVEVGIPSGSLLACEDF